MALANLNNLLCNRPHPGGRQLFPHASHGSTNAIRSKNIARVKRLVWVGTGKEDEVELGVSGLSMYKSTRGSEVNSLFKETELSRVNRFQEDIEERDALTDWQVQPEAKVEAASKQDRAIGRAVLLLVAVLWGTYSPAMKYMYSMPGSPTPVVLTALKAVIAAITLLLSSIFMAFNKRRNSGNSSGLVTEDLANGERSFVSNTTSDSRGKHSGFRSSLVVCGMELGLWSLLGTACHAVGLQYTTATQGAFLIQSTALFTPVIAAAAGNALSAANWIGCLVGLIGSVVVTLETTHSIDFGSGGLTGLTGDSFVLSAAFLYALSTVRLGAFALRFRAMDLATAKTVTLAFLAVVWALWDSSSAGIFSGVQSISSILGGFSTWPSLLVLIWTAIGPGALAAFLQAKGQQCLGPAESQVLFASTPFWSALFAWLFLSEGEMGILGWVGGCIIIVAGIFSSLDDKKKTAKEI